MARFSVVRVERWLWYVFLAVVAWQSRNIIWQADGRFIEWHAAVLYGTDFIMAGLFTFALWQYVRSGKGHRALHGDRIDKALVLFLSVTFISIRSTDSLTVSVYQWIRLAQYAAFFWYVRYWVRGRFNLDMSCLAFVVGALAQSSIALAQYILQRDIGLRWLGETLLRPEMPGVAVFYDLAQQKIMRAYGTLPHPNVLAVYLALALWAFAYLYVRHALGARRYTYTLVWFLSGSLLLWALYATFSRTMIASWFLSVLIFLAILWCHPKYMEWPNALAVRRRVRELVVSGVLVSAVFGGLFWRQIGARMLVHSQDEAVQLRVYYAKEAISSGGHSLLSLNWTGIGIGNFVTWLKRTDPGYQWYVYQPAHNLYLLLYSEIGIVGVLVFWGLLASVIRRFRHSHANQPIVRIALGVILGSLLFIGLFDHFFWTLQQGRILFWLFLAMIV